MAPSALAQVAVKEFVVADVAVLPGPQHRQEVVGVPRQEQPFPETDKEILQRRVSHLLDVGFDAVERLREAPAGIDATEGAQSLVRRFLVPAVVERRVGLQRGLGALEKHEVVARAFRRSLKRQNTFDHVGIKRAPVIGLQCAHRPAGHQLDLLDPEFLRHQPMLLANIVVGGHIRELRPVPRRRRVARRGRQAVAEHVRNDDEIFRRIERHAGCRSATRFRSAGRNTRSDRRSHCRSWRSACRKSCRPASRRAASPCIAGRRRRVQKSHNHSR